MSLEETVAVLQRVQSEQVAWVLHNFPRRLAVECLLGAHEEYHEAMDALGETEPWLDAVADHTIFLLDLCTALGFRSEELVAYGWEVADFSGRPWSRHLGKLTHHFLKQIQGVRGSVEWHRTAMQHRIGCILATIEREVELLGLSYPETIASTWDKVKQRDWIAYPKTGFPPNGRAAYEPPSITPLGPEVLRRIIACTLRELEMPADLVTECAAKILPAVQRGLVQAP